MNTERSTDEGLADPLRIVWRKGSLLWVPSSEPDRGALVGRRLIAERALERIEAMPAEDPELQPPNGDRQ